GQYRKLEPGRVMTSPRNSGETRIAVLDIQEAPPCQATAMNTELFGQRGRRLALTQTIDDASFEGRTERAAGARWMIWIHLTPQGLGVQLLGVSSFPALSCFYSDVTVTSCCGAAYSAVFRTALPAAISSLPASLAVHPTVRCPATALPGNTAVPDRHRDTSGDNNPGQPGRCSAVHCGRHRTP